MDANPFADVLNDLRFPEFYDPVMPGAQYIFLLLDGHGKVLRVLNRPHFQFQLNLKEILAAESVFSFYDASTLSDGPGVSVLTQKKRFQWSPFAPDIYTQFPISLLHLKRLRGGVFLGRVSYSEFMPNITARNLASFLFVDTLKDTLLGFSRDFYAWFQDRFPAPEGMFDLPLGAFFSPTPSEIQGDSLPPDPLAGFDGIPPVYDKDFSAGSLTPREEIPVAMKSASGPGGLLLENEGTDEAYFTVLQGIDTASSDICVSLSFENHAGNGPCFILGERYRGEDAGLDNDGYLIGRAFDTGRAILKKRTFVACVAGAPQLGPGPFTYRFCKSGRSFFLFEDGKKLLAYFDAEAIGRNPAFLTLEIRPGHRFVLRRLTLRTAPSSEIGGVLRPRRPVVRLNRKEGSYFSLDRFYTYKLSDTPMSHVAGFLLNDVTEFQEKFTALDGQYRRLLKKIQAPAGPMVGSGRAISALKSLAKTAAQSEAAVLIEGPTGSGKELLAQYIHENSSRKNGPFVKVDCSTLPKGLIESQLFGHEKGAFTGAAARNIGFFEKADGGTLFLDEVGNLGLDVQAKLLQFFNNLTIVRLGSTTPRRLNVRCLLASNAALDGMVSRGTFREDLYFRVNVIRLVLPPLRERMEDLPELCNHFLLEFSAETRKDIREISAGAQAKLEGYAWPGNVRELRNVIQRAVIFCAGNTLTGDLIQFTSAGPGAEPVKGRKPRTPFYFSMTDKRYVLRLFAKHLGVVSAVAKELGVERQTLYNYLKREKIDPGRYRKGFDRR